MWMKMKYWLFICHNFFIFSSIFDKLVSSLGWVVVAVLNSEFSWLTIVIWFVIWWGDWSSEWKPLEESSDLWSFVMWVNWKRKVVVDTVIEGGQLSGLGVVEDVLLNLGIWSLVELVVLVLGSNESGVWSIIHFVSGITELGDMVKSLTGLSVVNEFITGEVIVPSNTIMELSGSIIIVPFHLWVILQEVLKLDELEDTGFVWKGWGWDNEIISEWLWFIPMEVHALSRLHGGGHWLWWLLNEFWGSTAFKDLDFEINIRVEWDWLSSNWWPGESISVSIGWWAVKSSNITLVELGESKIPTFEDLVVTKGEGLWSLVTLHLGVSNNSSILESSNPVNGSPVSNWALWSRSLLIEVNSNSRHVIVWADVLVIVTIWTKYIWGCRLVDFHGWRSGDKSNYGCWKLDCFHVFNEL